MSSAGNIRRSGAVFEISAEDERLAAGLNDAVRKVSTFGGSVNQLGDQIGTKFGKSVMGGVAGAFGVHALDQALRAAVGAVKIEGTGRDLGIAIGDSLVEGLKSVPIAGALGELNAMLVGAATGIDIYEGDKIAAAQAKAAKANAFRGSTVDKAAGMAADAAAAGDPGAMRRLAFDREVSSEFQRGISAGLSPAEIRELLVPMREEFERMQEIEAQKSLQEMADAMQGVVDAVDAAAVQRAAESLSRIDAVIGSLAEDVATSGMSESDRTRRELEGLGAAPEQIAEALHLIAEREFLAKMRDPTNSFDPGSAQAVEDMFSSSASGSFQAAAFAGIEGGSQVIALNRTSEKIERNTKRAADAAEKNLVRWGA